MRMLVHEAPDLPLVGAELRLREVQFLARACPDNGAARDFAFLRRDLSAARGRAVRRRDVDRRDAVPGAAAEVLHAGGCSARSEDEQEAQREKKLHVVRVLPPEQEKRQGAGTISARTYGGDLVSTWSIHPDELQAEVAGWPRKSTGKNQMRRTISHSLPNFG